MVYTMLTARVIFTAKTSLDLFSLGRKQVWTLEVCSIEMYRIACRPIFYKSVDNPIVPK